jgi:hypothetical protein
MTHQSLSIKNQNLIDKTSYFSTDLDNSTNPTTPTLLNIFFIFRKLKLKFSLSPDSSLLKSDETMKHPKWKETLWDKNDSIEPAILRFVCSFFFKNNSF